MAITSEEEKKNCCVDGPITALLHRRSFIQLHQSLIKQLNHPTQHSQYQAVSSSNVTFTMPRHATVCKSLGPGTHCCPVILQVATYYLAIPIEVMAFFHLPNSYTCSMALVVYSASNRNEYRESSWGVKCSWSIKLTTSLPSDSRLSRKCENLNIYRPPWPVTGIALLFTTK
jgi:hypothetical protein